MSNVIDITESLEVVKNLRQEIARLETKIANYEHLCADANRIIINLSLENHELKKNSNKIW